MNSKQRDAFIKAESTLSPGWWRRIGGSCKEFIDAKANVTCDVEIAWGILEFWAIEDGKFNGTRAPVELMFKYLCRRCGRPNDVDRPLKDLRQILDASADRKSLADWIAPNFKIFPS